MKEHKKYATAYILLAILLLGAFSAAFTFGSVNLGPQRIIEAFFGTDKTAAIIIGSIRLPRALGAGLAGFALAAAGTLLQCVTNNGLCAPNIIGINSGAGFAVILMLCLAPTYWQWLPVAAFLGAIVATAVVMSISFGAGGAGAGKPVKGSSIVLAGVAVSSILSAGISFLSIRFPDVLTSYIAFSVGGFSGTSLRELFVPAIITAVAFIAAQLICPKLNLLCLGDEIASSLGIRVKLVRIAALICAAALCAAAVSFAGLLGFVGLIVPHIIRALCGNDMRFNLSLSAISGAVLVILSDLAGRIIFAPSELPAGIIMALIGAPFFLYLLLKRRNSYD